MSNLIKLYRVPSFQVEPLPTGHYRISWVKPKPSFSGMFRIYYKNRLAGVTKATLMIDFGRPNTVSPNGYEVFWEDDRYGSP